MSTFVVRTRCMSIAASSRLVVLLILAALSATPAGAVPPLTTQLVADNLTLPIVVTAAPGDATRLFIAEQGADNTTHKAQIRVLNRSTGQVLNDSFLQFSDLEFNENLGLLGMAFSPNYATDGDVYVDVSSLHGDGITYQEIRRYHVSAANPNIADPASMKLIGAFPTLHGNHNAGWIGFGPQDGYLYMTRGDGNSGAGQGLPAQDLTSSYGKILRIDVASDGFPLDPAKNYAIPPTNPFVGQDALPEIWALGVRNPFRASFDRQTGDLYFGDVGSNRFEEINFHAANSAGGQNYGWPYFEGAAPNPNYPNPSSPAVVDPIYTFQRPPAGGAAVIGGYVYRGSDIPGLQGAYFFSDYINNQFYSFHNNGNAVSDVRNRTAELNPNGNFGAVFSYGEDARGELYIADGAGGRVFQIIAATPPIPGDANGDDKVTGADYTLWATHFGTQITNAGFSQGDFNGDGLVTGADYTIWATNFTTITASNAVTVPEPSGFVLSGTAMSLLGLMIGSGLLRRR